ncbi:hypothetical protein ID875_00850 [Streptomyces globisporus]|uniref:HNH/Endo VII superfamily nuclease toxins domain-containing protein n=2 Tax=Streptomyces TaxID=1883 RepID=A0A927GLI4_STRGL|nr:hypothetical protein [Streptomyces globisporus]
MVAAPSPPTGRQASDHRGGPTPGPPERNTAAGDAQGKVKEALAHAPAEPPPLDRLGNNVVDGFKKDPSEFVGRLIPELPPRAPRATRLVWPRTTPFGTNGRPRSGGRETGCTSRRRNPRGNSPLEVRTHVPATTPEWQGGKQLMGEDHQPIYYREEVYEHPNGNDLIVYQDHWFGHQKPGEPGYQPAHVHVRPFENTRNGQVPGCEEHYYDDR